YITKPIKPLVLISRVKALLRRRFSGTTQENQTELGDLKINHDKYLVIKGGTEINLPNKEFKLLALLSAKPGKVFTRESILQQVWGDEVIVGDRTIDVHVRKLREKLGDEYIKTIKGVGYKFEF
ncbi:MAG: winged helix-turn-helix domain-containing protein, partial [Bacteroidota bacterium]